MVDAKIFAVILCLTVNPGAIRARNCQTTGSRDPGAALIALNPVLRGAFRSDLEKVRQFEGGMYPKIPVYISANQGP